MDNTPNLFIVGEPRSGTTTLHDLIGQHPDIFMSAVKEPHYFSRINFPPPEDKILRITRNKHAYQKLFEDGKESLWRGESSTYYLADPESPKLIKETVPNAKIIAVLRDPVDRAYSHYLLYSRRGEQKLSFHETIQEILKNENKVEPVYNLIELGRYHKHINNYMKYFDRNQMLILFFDDLKRDPDKVLRQIFNFLNLEDSYIEKIQQNAAHNPYVKPRNKLFNWLMKSKLLTNWGLKIIPRPLLGWLRYRVFLKKDKKPPLEQETVAVLSEIYKPEIKKLEEALKKDCKVLQKTWRAPKKY